MQSTRAFHKRKKQTFPRSKVHDDQQDNAGLTSGAWYCTKQICLHRQRKWVLFSEMTNLTGHVKTSNELLIAPWGAPSGIFLVNLSSVKVCPSNFCLRVFAVPACRHPARGWPPGEPQSSLSRSPVPCQLHARAATAGTAQQNQRLLI